MDLKRINTAKKYEKDFQRNCIGTAMYLAGIVEKDLFMSSTDALTLLENLVREDQIVKTTQPQKDCLIILKHPTFKGYLTHMGVVTELQPLTMTHRFGRRGKLVESELVSSVLEHYNNTEKRRYQNPHFNGFIIEYYTP